MHVALTGATGFLGLRLLAEFLGRGDEVTVLARMSPERAVSALQRGLRGLGWPAEELGRGLAKVRACQVELDAEGFGLGVAEFRALADSVDAVWHSAGQTSLSGDAAKCSINVDGTRRVLELATQSQRRPVIHHISTAFVAGRVRKGVVLESDLYLGRGFANEYERSKCRAEQLVRAWSQAFDRQAVVYRPSVLVTDRVPGYGLPTHPLATLAMLFEQIFGARRTGDRWPRRSLRIYGSPSGYQNMLQVEQAARAMVRLSEATLASHEVTTYHVVHPRETPINRTVAMLESVIPVQITMTEQDDQCLWRPSEYPELTGFLPYFAYERHYDIRNCQAAQVSIDPPDVTTEYLLQGVPRPTTAYV